MITFDYSFPPLLKDLHSHKFDYACGYGIDFEPYQEFVSLQQTRDWLQAWTGNLELSGEEYRIFGQDGSGGFAAFWCVNQKKDLLEQPIVFFGSEGELGIVAANFSDYLWLLAGGVGPWEAVGYSVNETTVENINTIFTAFASKHSRSSRATPYEIIAKANVQYPDFVSGVEALCCF